MIAVEFLTDSLVVQIGPEMIRTLKSALIYQIPPQRAFCSHLRQQHILIQAIRQLHDVIHALDHVGVQHPLKFQARLQIQRLKFLRQSRDFLQAVRLAAIRILNIVAKVFHAAGYIQDSCRGSILADHIKPSYRLLDLLLGSRKPDVDALQVLSAGQIQHNHLEKPPICISGPAYLFIISSDRLCGPL